MECLTSLLSLHHPFRLHKDHTVLLCQWPSTSNWYSNSFIFEKSRQWYKTWLVGWSLLKNRALQFFLSFSTHTHRRELIRSSFSFSLNIYRTDLFKGIYIFWLTRSVHLVISAHFLFSTFTSCGVPLYLSIVEGSLAFLFLIMKPESLNRHKQRPRSRLGSYLWGRNKLCGNFPQGNTVSSVGQTLESMDA